MSLKNKGIRFEMRFVRRLSKLTKIIRILNETVDNGISSTK
jgi:hypothetical protein